MRVQKQGGHSLAEVQTGVAQNLLPQGCRLQVKVGDLEFVKDGRVQSLDQMSKRNLKLSACGQPQPCLRRADGADIETDRFAGARQPHRHAVISGATRDHAVENQGHDRAGLAC